MASKEEEREQFLKQFEAGSYIKDLRGERTLAEVGKNLGVSPNYLSAVERGRLPSDHFISKLAKYFEVDEDELFIMWGKVPILATEYVESNETLQRTLAQMSRNDKFNEEEKQELYDDIYETYQRFIKRKKEGR